MIKWVTPLGVTHLNNTRIEVFPAFIIVEYQLFITSKYHQNHAEQNYEF